MRYLLDTNIFLWWLNGDNRLKAALVEIIKNPENQVFVSIVSAWEVSIKHKAGKLPLKTTVRECFVVSEFGVLSIDLEDVLRLDDLPPVHKDPFDRLLIAQSLQRDLILVTSDRLIAKYKLTGFNFLTI